MEVMPNNISSLESHMNNINMRNAILPFLPDDLWLAIFDNLTTEERVPLGLTCKRFRHLDFELGKKSFATIKVHRAYNQNWEKLEVLATGQGTEYNLRYENFDPVRDSTYHNMRLFRNAKTEYLKIWHNNPIYEEADLDFIWNILNTVTYKKLNIDLIHVRANSDVFLHSIMRNRNIDNAQINILLNECDTAYDMNKMRNMVKQLPRVEKFRMDWRAITHSTDIFLSDECLIDDEALLHIISHTNHAELDKSCCSAEGILRAFEMICKSSLATKYISLLVPKLAVIELFSDSTLKYDTTYVREQANGEIRDRESQTVLMAFARGSYYHVDMHKYAEEDNRLHEEVDWFLYSI